MTKTPRTIVTIALVTTVLFALGATVYTFRARLAETPIVAAVFDRPRVADGPRPI